MDFYGYVIATALNLWLILCGCSWVRQDGVMGQPGLVTIDTDGGYQGLLVAIDPSVPFNPLIITNIYDYLKETSKALNEAFQVKDIDIYFKEATVLVPQTWPHLPECKEVTSEMQNEAAFVVSRDSLQRGSAPHTVQLSSQCGHEGLVTVLPESFVTDGNEARKYGENIGKTLAHEWAHLRYGAFDEDVDGPSGLSCIMLAEHKPLPVKCSQHIQGRTTVSQDHHSCEFIPHSSQSPDVKASLMFLPYLDTVSTFCDEQGLGLEHNDQVPNDQNSRCDGRSVWSVIEQHPDVRNRARSTETHEGRDLHDLLSLRCVQPREQDRMVLAMDVSASMQEGERLLHMQQDVSLFLQTIPCRDTYLGLVEFSSSGTANVLHHLVPLQNNTDSLLGSIPQRVVDKSCIGCGIRKSLSLLREHQQDTKGAVMVVFTDGLENDSPRIREIEAEVLRSGVVIYSILLLDSAHNHPLLSLSEKTGGQTCMYTDSPRSTYYDCLEKVLYHRAALKTPTQILSSGVSIPAQSEHRGSVILDLPVRRHVIVSVTWDDFYHEACNTLTVELISTEGESVGPSDIDRYQVNMKLRSISIDVSHYKAERWTYVMRHGHDSMMCSVRILVEGRQLFSNCSQQGYSLHPITALPYLDNNEIQLNPLNTDLENSAVLYVRVVQGSNPVIRANVTAHIQDSHGNNWFLKLWDNGAGADQKKDDGIYSRYFFQFVPNEHSDTYSIQYEVVWTEETRLQMSRSSVGLGAPPLPQYIDHSPGTDHLAVPPFQRSVHGGHVTVYSNKNSPVLLSPAKVSDLKITAVYGSDKDIMVSWTAVGECLDSGKVSFCDVQIAPNASQLRRSFYNTITVGRIISLQSAGMHEVHIISLTYLNVSYHSIFFTAIKCFNEKNMGGPVSNIDICILSPQHNRTYENELSIQNEPPSWIWYVIGVSLTCIITLNTCLLCMVHRHKKRRRDTGETRSHGDMNERGLSYVETSGESCTPDIISEIQHTKTGLKKQNRYHKKPDGSLTVSKQSSSSAICMKYYEQANKACRISDCSQLGQFSNFKQSKQRLELSNMISGPWDVPNEPLQNHTYSNPLYGESGLVPELELTNSVIAETK